MDHARLPLRRLVAGHDKVFLEAERFRDMSPSDRLAVATSLSRPVVRLASAGVRLRHPNWDALQVLREVLRERRLHARRQEAGRSPLSCGLTTTRGEPRHT